MAVKLTIPDLGDFADVEVIEIVASPGDVVAVEDPLITLETDKAAMDVPSPDTGVIEAIDVQVGDRVSTGTVIGKLKIEVSDTVVIAPAIQYKPSGETTLVAAAENGASDLLLLGYHGKLVKLAGGVFHTHHHLADARLEVLTALGVSSGLTLPQLQRLLDAESVEAALRDLSAAAPVTAERLWNRVASTVEQRSQAYVARYGDWSIRLGAALFDRSRNIRWRGPGAERFFTLMD